MGVGDDSIIVNGDGNVGIGKVPSTTSRLYIEGDLEVNGTIVNPGLSGTSDELLIGSSSDSGRLTVDGRLAIGTTEPAIPIAIGDPNAGLDYKNRELHLAHGDYPGVVLGALGDVSIGNKSIAIDTSGNLTVGTETETKELNLHGTCLAEFIIQWGTAIRVVKDFRLSENTKKEVARRPRATEA